MKIKKLLISLLLLISCMFAFTACTGDPYKDYKTSGFEPKTKIGEYSEQNFSVWNTENELKLLTSYSEYASLDVWLNLGYTKAYFELNSLMIFLKTGCSSDNIQFVKVLENEGKLYPVLESNEIGADDPVTEDIIYYVFYVEIPNSGNYTVGEIISKTRAENVML